MNALLLHLLQAALNSLTLSRGIPPARVLIRMPVNGWPALPFIVINLELIQQTATAIGENVENPTPDNIWSLFAAAQRTVRISIIAADVDERDFYRDTVLAVFRVLDAVLFSAIGLRTAHAFQAVSYPSAEERDGQVPGFYCAELLLQADSDATVSVRTDYPIILGISSNPAYQAPDFSFGAQP